MLKIIIGMNTPDVRYIQYMFQLEWGQTRSNSLVFG